MCWFLYLIRRSYRKRGKMLEKCLFLPLKWPKSHANYDFLTPGGPIYLPINYYRNFAHSLFNIDHSSFQRRSIIVNNVILWWMHLGGWEGTFDWRDILAIVFDFGFDLAEHRRLEFKHKYWLIDWLLIVYLLITLGWCCGGWGCQQNVRDRYDQGRAEWGRRQRLAHQGRRKQGRTCARRYVWERRRKGTE